MATPTAQEGRRLKVIQKVWNRGRSSSNTQDQELRQWYQIRIGKGFAKFSGADISNYRPVVYQNRHLDS